MTRIDAVQQPPVQAAWLGVAVLALALPAAAPAGGAAGARRAAAVRRGGHGPGDRPQARGEPAVGALLHGRADAADAPQPGRGEHRGRRRERRRLLGPEPRPRPEPDRHARRLGRPDRLRPTGRQGAGRRLSRRVGPLAVALHAGHRPVRHVAHRCSWACSMRCTSSRSLGGHPWESATSGISIETPMTAAVRCRWT